MATKKDKLEGRNTSSEGIVKTLSDILAEFTNLIQTELQLLRTELSNTAGALGLAITVVLGGAVLLVAAAMLLLQTGIAALVANGWSPPLATLIVAIGVLLLGALLLWVGMSKLRLKNLIPTKTINQLEQDAAVVKAELGAS
jgi:hypothetical protein